MNRDEIESMLADYLGGELPADQVHVFERALAADPALRAEAESLRRALGAFRSLGGDAVAAPAAPAGRRHAPIVLVRYAAVIAVGFATGYLFRGSPPGAGPPAPSPETDGWRTRFAQSYMEQPAEGGGLARSLVALSRASR